MCVLKIFKNLLYIDVVLVPLMGLFRYWRQCTEGGPDAAGDEDKPSEGKIWFISTEPAEDEDKPSEGKNGLSQKNQLRMKINHQEVRNGLYQQNQLRRRINHQEVRMVYLNRTS